MRLTSQQGYLGRYLVLSIGSWHEVRKYRCVDDIPIPLFARCQSCHAIVIALICLARSCSSLFMRGRGIRYGARCWLIGIALMISLIGEFLTVHNFPIKAHWESSPMGWVFYTNENSSLSPSASWCWNDSRGGNNCTSRPTQKQGVDQSMQEEPAESKAKMMASVTEQPAIPVSSSLPSPTPTSQPVLSPYRRFELKRNEQILRSKNKQQPTPKRQSSSKSSALEPLTPTAPPTNPPLPNRTHLVFHVGPAKTGTTTLQTDFTNLRAILERDNYVYAGRFYYYYYANQPGQSHNHKQSNPHPLQQSSEHLHHGDQSLKVHRNWTGLHETARNMLKRFLCKQHPLRLCLSSFVRELIPYRGRNVLLSDEAWGALLWKTPQDYEAIRQATREHFRTTIIVGYRPYFQWLRSDFFQRNRLDLFAEWKNAWPGMYWRDHRKDVGRNISWLFPNYYRYENMIRKSHRFTDFVLHNARGQVDDVRIIHLTEQGYDSSPSMNLERPLVQSLRTKFLCHALPDAPASCAHSRAMDHSIPEVKLNEYNATSSMHINHDRIATTAAAMGLVDTKLHTRPEVREALRHFHEVELQRSAVTGYPLICPSREELEDFWNLTLELEEYCLGRDWSRRVRETTRAMFEKESDSKFFCTANLTAVLEMPLYLDFFRNKFDPHPKSKKGKDAVSFFSV